MSRDYDQIAEDYATAVVNGDILAGLYVRLACERFFRDLEREATVGDIVLSDDGARWCRFLEKLPHVKGQWARKQERFILSPWQVFCTVNMYGWKWVATGLRRFREAYIEVPRKNGKSHWFGCLGVAHLCIDGEFGAEVYCGATTEKQAWEVFRPARLVCEQTPALREAFGVHVNARSIATVDKGGRFEPVIGNPGDGASPSAAIADEYHEHPTSDQVDTFTTGMGAREQPMMLHITTAGSDMGGPCYAKRADCIDILKQSVEDDTIFCVIYCLDEGDAWDTDEAARKANPNYNVSVSAEFLRAQLNQARRSAAKQNSYRTKHLDEWVGAKTAWMNMLAYQRCRDPDSNIELHMGRRCFAALDLASKVDIASMALLFEEDGLYHAFLRHYLPDDVILEGGNTRYKEWHAAGWLIATPGNVIDFDTIEDDLRDIKSNHELVEVPYDPFQATQFASHMLEEGFPMIEVGATVRNFSEPMKELEKLILTQRMVFEMDPVLMWMFGNVVAKIDAKDNIFPRKERQESKIDGVVALIMALARSMMSEDSGIVVPDGYTASVM